MKVLLCGDYSSVHSELSEALKNKGHDVTVISDGDSYKAFPADIKLEANQSLPNNYVFKAFYLLVDFIGLAGIFKYFKQMKNVKLEEYDVVQLINVAPIKHFGAFGNFFFVRRVAKCSKKVVLCALGDDACWSKACLKGVFKYSPLDRISLFNFYKYYYSLKYVYSPAYRFLDFFVNYISSAVVAGLDDYRIAYEKSGKKVYFIRLPIGEAKFKKTCKEGGDYSVKIFHAWQYGKEVKKGNDKLDEAVQAALEEVEGVDVEYRVAGGMKYDDFIKAYDCCDVFIDQAYSYDRGVTGALGMCSGKVVLSGFELDSPLGLMGLENVKNNGVNVSGDVEEDKKSLIEILLNPGLRKIIQDNAYDFAVKNYRSDLIAEQYLAVWRHHLDLS